MRSCAISSSRSTQTGSSPLRNRNPSSFAPLTGAVMAVKPDVGKRPSMGFEGLDGVGNRGFSRAIGEETGATCARKAGAGAGEGGGRTGGAVTAGGADIKGCEGVDARADTGGGATVEVDDPGVDGKLSESSGA